jgi:hypothetical protein
MLFFHVIFVVGKKYELNNAWQIAMRNKSYISTLT